ncbi:MAG: hypothetical protein QUV35_15665 [Hydrogenophaga sp.]|uniref:hypothetical protein n=1 Tax=Hydrogenophaga sp. TaxID=1904254 RepID=UPI0026045046|nr:hypothetical protein [Hydrogenophaga sp.]MDM7944060.1 hypothetical protein [Hydrogenophaga sp.]
MAAHPSFLVALVRTRRVWLAATCLWLAGCGVETAGTAAAIGAAQTQEIERGRLAQEQVQQELQKSAERAQQRADPLANGY